MKRRCLGRCGRKIARGSYCPACKAQRDARYKDATYQRNRSIVLAAANGKCHCPGCGKCDGDCQRIATEANHVQPGGSHELWNLRAECKSCNSSKRNYGDR